MNCFYFRQNGANLTYFSQSRLPKINLNRTTSDVHSPKGHFAVFFSPFSFLDAVVTESINRRKVTWNARRNLEIRNNTAETRTLQS